MCHRPFRLLGRSTMLPWPMYSCYTLFHKFFQMSYGSWWNPYVHGVFHSKFPSFYQVKAQVSTCFHPPKVTSFLSRLGRAARLEYFNPFTAKTSGAAAPKDQLRRKQVCSGVGIWDLKVIYRWLMVIQRLVKVMHGMIYYFLLFEWNDLELMWY